MEKKLSDILFASDMDDTLLNSEKEISVKNRRAIADFMAQGGKFVIATGRAVPATAPYVKDLEVPYPCILYNGAAIYDFTEERFLWTADLPDTARDYMKEIMATFPEVGAEILKEEKIFVVRKNEHVSRHVDIERLDYTEVAIDDVANGWFKILFVMDEAVLDRVWDYIMRRGYRDVDFVKSSVNYIEMLPSGISKGTTLLRLADLLGVPRENTAGIGDYNNDIELIQNAGIGFAVENAPAEIQAIADQVAPDCNHDAVAWAIEFTKKQHGVF